MSVRNGGSIEGDWIRGTRNERFPVSYELSVIKRAPAIAIHDILEGVCMCA